MSVEQGGELGVQLGVQLCMYVYSLYQTRRVSWARNQQNNKYSAGKNRQDKQTCSSAYAIYGVQSDHPHRMSLRCLLRYVLQVG